MLYSGIHYPRVNRFGEQLKLSGVNYPRELRFGEQTETLRYTIPKRAQVWSQLKPSGIHYPKNRDELCCTRAIVTAKARLDQHPNWDGFKRGRRIQAEHAVDLHHETRVPRGPCGYDELWAFSLAPSLYDYQILLCDAKLGYVVTSFGPPSQKQLIFLYSDGHYNVITSLPGFFGTSYFCARCLKPYDNQGHHACDNNPDYCSACLQTGCPDYTKAQCRSLPAMQTCDLCRFMFYGMHRHRVGRPRITSNWASVWVVGSAATVANSLWVANSNKNTSVATSRVLCVTITSKPCRISASFKWLRLPRKNGRNVMPNEDLVVICVMLLLAWPPCTPTRTMCPPLLFFLHLLWMVSTSMTKNLRYTYSSTWRSCRTRDVTFQISSTPFLINPTSDAFLTLPTSCQTQVKLDLLRNRGFRVVEIWECQWEKLKRELEDVCAFVDALNLSAPLNPRDAFFGGRRNASTTR